METVCSEWTRDRGIFQGDYLLSSEGYAPVIAFLMGLKVGT